MEAMIMTTQLLLSLSILVVLHEWGHYVTARMFDIKVEKFYLFFDFLFPMSNLLKFSLFKYKKGDTEYGIGWFPLGGYVKIAGMVDESMDTKQMRAPAQPWEFRAKPAWQRLIVMLGGIIVNLILGVCIFIAMVYWQGDSYVTKDYVNNHGGIQAMELAKSIGLQTGDKIININGEDFNNFQDILKPSLLLEKNAYYTVERDGKPVRIDIPANFIERFNRKTTLLSFVRIRIPAVVDQISSNQTIAVQVGLQSNDRFVMINDSPITYQDELIAVLQNTDSDSIFFTISREGSTLSFHVPFHEKRIIGFYPKGLSEESLVHVDYNIAQSTVLGVQRSFGVVWLQVKAFKKILTGEMSFSKNLSGPIGMAQAFGVEWNWGRFWYMTGLLSMVLAVMNLLPIPALDGGYVMFLLYEMIVGKRPSEKFFEFTTRIGMALFMILIIYVFYNDIAKLITG